MREQVLQQQIRLSLGSRPDLRLFRNNVGALKDAKGNIVRYGLCTGSSDLIGIRAVKITPEMVGSTIGQFVALEVKTPTGRATPEQQRFLATVRALGGVGELVRDTASASRVLE